MSLTSAMLIGFTGVQSNAVGVDTVGDNLANLNTTAFKGQRTLFETLLYRTVSEGKSPDATTGGTLPKQLGTGSTVGSIQRSFAQGGIESTGFQSDLALDGDGFFILRAGTGEQVYTRDGSFRLDATGTLVSADGSPVQAFAADAQGDVTPGTPANLVIPVGTANEAVATTEVIMDGRLDSGTTIASVGEVAASQPLATSSGTPATSASQLTDLVNDDGVPLFATGDVLSINAAKGGIAVPESTFVVGTNGSTLGDFAGFVESVTGINTDPTVGGSPGVSIADGTDHPAGTMVIKSNPGEINAIQLDGASILNTTGVVPSPFAFTATSPAVGGGLVTTSFGVFDSLGNTVPVRLRIALESKSETGSTWRFYAESEDDSDLSPVLGTGTVSFDTNGQFIGATGADLSIDRAGVGSTSPVTVALDFSGLTGLTGPQGDSELIMDSQDGAPAGIMIGYAVDRDGIVTASFSNQQTRVLGQIALATFTNTEGLVAQSENTFVPGVDSGDPTVRAPRTGKAGSIIAGALEQGNVEISREFVNLISYSTAISSASRVVRAADDLLQELLLLAR